MAITSSLLLTACDNSSSSVVKEDVVLTAIQETTLQDANTFIETGNFEQATIDLSELALEVDNYDVTLSLKESVLGENELSAETIIARLTATPENQSETDKPISGQTGMRGIIQYDYSSTEMSEAPLKQSTAVMVALLDDLGTVDTLTDEEKSLLADVAAVNLLRLTANILETDEFASLTTEQVGIKVAENAEKYAGVLSLTGSIIAQTKSQLESSAVLEALNDESGVVTSLINDIAEKGQDGFDANDFASVLNATITDVQNL